MDVDAGPPSLFVVVEYFRDYFSKYPCSIIRLETPPLGGGGGGNHPRPRAEYEEEEVIPSNFSAHIPDFPLWGRSLSWAISHPPANSTEDLYILPDYKFEKPENVGSLPGFIFNLSTKKCKIIKPPQSSKHNGHAVTMGDHIYYMAQPMVNINSSPGYIIYEPYDTDPCSPCHPLFERYDTLSHSWEALEPLPNTKLRGYIVGTAVLDDTILFNISKRILWAYNAGRNKWYIVNVSDNLCYCIEGVAVVIDNIIYALTEACDSVVALTLKTEEIKGEVVFTCDLHKRYAVPGMARTTYEFRGKYDFDFVRRLVHLGKDNFCVVKSCVSCNSQKNQCIQLTNIKLSEEESTMTKICRREFDTSDNKEFTIMDCISMPKHMTSALKEGTRILNLEDETEIVTLPPEMLQCLDEYSSAIKASTLSDGVASEYGRINTDEEGQSISVRNMPLHFNFRQLVKGLKKFGPIKSIQINPDYLSESWLADVEFESATSKQNAIKASSIIIGGRVSLIENNRVMTRYIEDDYDYTS